MSIMLSSEEIECHKDIVRTRQIREIICVSKVRIHYASHGYSTHHVGVSILVNRWGAGSYVRSKNICAGSFILV